MANRIGEILERILCGHNHADTVTRGISAEPLKTRSRVNGPSLLKMESGLSNRA